MEEFLFGAFLALIGLGFYSLISSDTTHQTHFHNQCVEAGGTPVRFANQGDICLKDATQIPLIKPV